MSTSPDSILALAKQLLTEHGGNEDGVRAAASRAFNAAVHFCVPVVAKIPAASGATTFYKKMIDDLLGFYHDDDDYCRSVRSLGSMLKQVRDLRTKADYHISEPFTVSDATVLIRGCERIREKISSLGK